jgi:ribosomal protein S21
MLWKYLKTFNLPIWFAGKSSYDYGIKTFTAIGGRITSSLYSLKSDEEFTKVLKNYKRKTQRCQPAGIIVVRTMQFHSSIFKQFNATYPQMILLGQATNKFVRSKYHTNKLFENSELAQYKPKFKICEKRYTPTLAQSIIDELGGDIFVIKPIEAALGNGVIMIDKSNLDQTLRILFKDMQELELYKKDMSYYHWKRDQKDFFIVEEYVPSKIIYARDKPYDPTMRVMFTLQNLAGKISINFFDAYWKLPIKSLEENGSLTEKHKSHIGTGTASSLPVDYADFEMVKALLSNALPELYLKMLQSWAC